MSETDFLGEAVSELYGSDPEGFTERRAVLAAQARAAGDRAAAKEIAGLRKPTRPAWMINQLVRADPGVADRLTGLGDELRAAAAALDGAKIRELSQARRRLIDTLIRQTLQQADEQSPPAGLREDLTATFGAALADPQVARELAAGTLPRAVHRADFSAGIPGLTLVPPPAGATAGTTSPGKTPTAGSAEGDAEAAEVAAAGEKSRAAWRGRTSGTTRAGRAATARRDRGVAAAAGPADAAQAAAAAKKAAAAQAAEHSKAVEEARAAREARAAEERRRALAEAEQALAEATQVADQAAQAERDGRDTVRALESQLDEARRRLAEARRRVRETQGAQQKARRALGRLAPDRHDRD